MELVRSRTAEESDLAGVDRPRKLAVRLRSTLFDCIDAEHADAGSTACAPPVDIVVVDATGARIVSSSMSRDV